MGTPGRLLSLVVAILAPALAGCSGRLSGGHGSDGGGDPDAPVAPPEARLRISEVLYHPVEEDAFEDRHEWVEIANAGRDPVTLTGWRLTAETVAYDFPAGQVIEPGAYLVIAKDRARVAAVWGLDPATVL